MNSIDSVTSLSVEQFDELYFQVGKPVVYKGGVRQSKVCKDWTNEYLASKLRARRVQVKHTEDGIYDFNKKFIKKLELPFDEALEYFCSDRFDNKSYYLQQVSIPHAFPELVGDLETPEWTLASDIMQFTNLWVGGAGCVTPLHYDKLDNFLVQVRGRKELILFSPEDSKYIYPSSNPGGTHLSQVDAENPDLTRFPAFASAKPIHLVLEAGDVLFIPPHWWHHVRSLDMCISINYWWQRFDVPPKNRVENIDAPTIAKLIQPFVNAGCDINHRLVNGEWILLKAIRNGLANVVEALLSLGADANVISSLYEPGKSALSMAAARGNREIVQLLLKYGADRTWNGNAALQSATQNGNHELAGLLGCAAPEPV